MAVPKQGARSVAGAADQPSPTLSQAAREYQERGFQGNLTHALEQVADKAPKAAGQALGRTAKEFRENKELREKTAMALPIALASGLAAAEYIPAALSQAAYALNSEKAPALLWSLIEGDKSRFVQDAIVGYLPGTPVISAGGATGMLYSKTEGMIHDALGEFLDRIKKR